MPWTVDHEDNEVPVWFAIHFEAQHGVDEQLREEVLARIHGADLASEFKREGADV